MQTATITTNEIIARYDTILLDAYGVLVDKQGALPGAPAFIERLNLLGKPYFVLTNSASRLPEAIAAEFQAWGLAIAANQFITSGMLLKAYIEKNDLTGSNCLVLGPEDAWTYVEMAGGVPIALDESGEAGVLVIADQQGFDCLEGMNRALSMVLRRIDTGQTMRLLLCNPDIIYPLAPRQYGFTSGALAAMLEAALVQRYPGEHIEFVRLGKPYLPMFEAAQALSGTANLVMIGDQLATDILGANRFGIDSVLVHSGLAIPETTFKTDARPTYRLKRF